MVTKNNKSSSANIGFEEKLWATADKMRNNMDAAEYKHVVLGLIFLKYISDSFETVYNELKNDKDSLGPEERDEYISRRVFWVPKEARWAFLQDRAKLRLEVRKLLKKYGYPPDKEQIATDLVLEQAEQLSDKWANSGADLSVSNQYFVEPIDNFAIAEKKEEYNKGNQNG